VTEVKDSTATVQVRTTSTINPASKPLGDAPPFIQNLMTMLKDEPLASYIPGNLFFRKLGELKLPNLQDTKRLIPKYFDGRSFNFFESTLEKFGFEISSKEKKKPSVHMQRGIQVKRHSFPQKT